MEIHELRHSFAGTQCANNKNNVNVSVRGPMSAQLRPLKPTAMTNHKSYSKTAQLSCLFGSLLWKINLLCGIA